MPFTRFASSRVSRPLKIKLSPQEISEVSMENREIKAIAPRPLRGILASPTISRFTSGVVATTYPPMMMNTICMVKGTSAQKLFTPSMASLLADSRSHNPVTKTTRIPNNAKTRGSGNQRSLQVASARPKRASPDSALGRRDGTAMGSSLLLLHVLGDGQSLARRLLAENAD